ncbi:MAG: DUF721 domain-containing protein [Saprospiraceae bacterium]|nr:DUF721 domain-containing protein [Saprospiraceae bacterium]
MINKNDHRLSDLLQVFVQDRRFKPHLFEKKIEQGWREMMGPWVFRETRAVRLRGQTLVIEIESAALKQELHYTRDKICVRVNEMLGEEYVTEVIIK